LSDSSARRQMLARLALPRPSCYHFSSAAWENRRLQTGEGHGRSPLAHGVAATPLDRAATLRPARIQRWRPGGTRVARRAQGCGIVEFESPEEAAAAITDLHLTEVSSKSDL
jgi:hypothetical protein